MKFYGYNICGTCRKAQKFLDGKKVKYQSIDITETPPPKTVLKKALKTRELKRLFNTSGVQYKELNIKGQVEGDDGSAGAGFARLQRAAGEASHSGGRRPRHRRLR